MLIVATLPAEDPACVFDDAGDGTVPAGPILAATNSGYVIQAGRMVGGELIPDPEHWLLVPWACASYVWEMPSDWSFTEERLLVELFGADEAHWPPFILYYLYGREAGQTKRHRHGHVRLVGPEGLELKLGR
jgi:hypothetical protein